MVSHLPGSYDAILLLAVLLALTLVPAHYCRKGRPSATRVAYSEPAQRAARLPGVVADRGAGLQQQQHRDRRDGDRKIAKIAP